MDFIHVIVVLATVTAADGSTFEEVKAAQKRGFETMDECRASVSVTPANSKTPRGDLILGNMCVNAKTPPDKQQQHPDPLLKGMI